MPPLARSTLDVLLLTRGSVVVAHGSSCAASSRASGVAIASVAGGGVSGGSARGRSGTVARGRAACSRGDTTGTGTMAVTSSDALLREVVSASDAAVLGEVKVHGAIVPAAGEENEGEGENGDEEEIENAVPDEGTSDTEDVAAVREGPADNVHEPEEGNVAAEHGVVTARGAETGGGAAAVKDEGVHDEVQEGQQAKNEKSPFVVGVGEGGDQEADDPDPSEGNVEDDGGPRDAGYQAEGNNDDGERDYPVDVLGPVDLTRITAICLIHLFDDPVGEARSLGVVGDSTDKKGDGEEVVEDLLVVEGAEGKERNSELERLAGHSSSPGKAQHTKERRNKATTAQSQYEPPSVRTLSPIWGPL